MGVQILSDALASPNVSVGSHRTPRVPDKTL